MNKKVMGIIVAIIVIAIVGASVYMLTRANSADEQKKEKNGTQEVYALKVNNKEIKLGEVFSREECGQELQYSEVASCAFDGLDKTYTYENYEIKTGSEDKITSIYFIDEKISTTEGVKITDTYDKMVQVYSNNFKNEDNKYIYEKGNTLIEFIVENDVITGIEYIYK